MGIKRFYKLLHRAVQIIKVMRHKFLSKLLLFFLQILSTFLGKHAKQVVRLCDFFVIFKTYTCDSSDNTNE